MNKISGGDGITAELFQILKDDAFKVLHIICQQIWKTHQWALDRKKSVFITVSRRAMPKNVQIATQLNIVHFHASKVMFKILQAKL